MRREETGGDQATTERPCHGCGYDLRGLDDEALCPECGRPVRQSRHGTLAQLDRVSLTLLQLLTLSLFAEVLIVAGTIAAVVLISLLGLPRIAIELFPIAGLGVGVMLQATLAFVLHARLARRSRTFAKDLVRMTEPNGLACIVALLGGMYLTATAIEPGLFEAPFLLALACVAAVLRLPLVAGCLDAIYPATGSGEAEQTAGLVRSRIVWELATVATVAGLSLAAGFDELTCLVALGLPVFGFGLLLTTVASCAAAGALFSDARHARSISR